MVQHSRCIQHSLYQLNILGTTTQLIQSRATGSVFWLCNFFNLMLIFPNISMRILQYTLWGIRIV